MLKPLCHTNRLHSFSRRVKCLFGFCLAFLLPPAASGGETPLLVLSGQQLTLNARNVELRQVLKAFRNYGIEVLAPDTLTGRVDLQLENVPVSEALSRILGPYNHDTLWLSYPLPDGLLHTLTGIRIFDRDRPFDPIQPIEAPPRRLVTLPGGGEAVADEILIGLKPGTSVEEFRSLLRRLGGQVVEVDTWSGVYRIRLPANTPLAPLLARLKDHGILAAADANRIWKTAPPRPVSAGEGFPVNPLRIPEGGPALAVIDSGLAPGWIPDGMLRGGFDTTGENAPLSDPAGHGTQMALIATGLISPLGSAPSDTALPLVSIRGLDREGLLSTSGILSSLAVARGQGATVLSMSWGSPEPSPLLEAVFAKAAAEGMILVAAAGNDGKNQTLYPAAFPGVLSVGALSPDGSRWEGSNYGSGVDLFAFGHAAFPVGHQGPPGAYAGTSIATPWVARALTEYTQRYPDTDPAQVLQALRLSLTADPEGGPGRFDEQAKTRFLETGPSSFK